MKIPDDPEESKDHKSENMDIIKFKITVNVCTNQWRNKNFNITLIQVRSMK